MGFILYIIAILLIFPLTLLNLLFVENKAGYFLNTARNLDIFGNREFRSFWNAVLILPEGYKFGKYGETISSVLGKNQRDSTLKPCGKFLVKVLDKIENDHCLKSINNKI